jgi:hypothetical protein
VTASTDEPAGLKSALHLKTLKSIINAMRREQKGRQQGNLS